MRGVRALAMRRVASGLFVGLLLLAACKKEPSATPAPTKCTLDTDCTWAWKDRGECCVDPCGTSGHAVHLDENAAIIDYNTWYCTDDRRKPVRKRARARTRAGRRWR